MHYQIKEKVLRGECLSKEDILSLLNEKLEDLIESADEIRKFFCGNKFDLCCIINAKSGRCFENCKYCAQSSHYRTDIESFPLLDVKTVYDAAAEAQKNGIDRIAIVTSGKTPDESDFDAIVDLISDMFDGLLSIITELFGYLVSLLIFIIIAFIAGELVHNMINKALSPQKQPEINKEKQEIVAIQQQIQGTVNNIKHAIAFVPPAYRTSDALSFFVRSYHNSRVDNLKEAVNAFEMHMEAEHTRSLLKEQIKVLQDIQFQNAIMLDELDSLRSDIWLSNYIYW